MTTQQITPQTANDQIRQLYETAFPEDEQIPWDDLMRLVVEMPLDFKAYYDDEVMEQQEQSLTCLNSAESRENSIEGQNFIGFTIVYPCKSLYWFWYFAVREDLRGRGYGQQILTQLMEHYKGETIVLDMESPTQDCDNIEQRKRRRDFYLRNGFRDTHLYRNYNDITMTIMMNGEGTFTMQDWDEITNELKRFWWPEDIKEENA